MVEIAPMRVEDLPAVLEIERCSHVEPWGQGFFEEEMDRSQSFLLAARSSKNSSDVLGYICFWKVVDEIHILNLAVHVASRRQGVGRALMLEALAMGYDRSARVALLEVRRGNTAAQNLYLSLGFQPTGQRPNYYREMHEPAILMELEMDHHWKMQWLNNPNGAPKAGR
ncbi:MAG: ribosomal protein S18-alanine N-acetyltransferase [Syntrophobacteraceae bacterium]